MTTSPEPRTGADTSGMFVVHRTTDEKAPRITPALDPAWDELTKLTWMAACTNLDTGLECGVSRADLTVGGREQSGYYRVHLGASTSSPMTFRLVSAYLTGACTAGGNLGPYLDQAANALTHTEAALGRVTALQQRLHARGTHLLNTHTPAEQEQGRALLLAADALTQALKGTP